MYARTSTHHTQSQPHTHMHTHAHTHAHSQMHIHTQLTCTCTHMQAFTYVHTHTRTQTHTQSHTKPSAQSQCVRSFCRPWATPVHSPLSAQSVVPPHRPGSVTLMDVVPRRQAPPLQDAALLDSTRSGQCSRPARRWLWGVPVPGCWPLAPLPCSPALAHPWNSLWRWKRPALPGSCSSRQSPEGAGRLMSSRGCTRVRGLLTFACRHQQVQSLWRPV